MKKKRTKRAKRPNVKPIAAFGVAMSTLAVTQVPTAQADIVALTPAQSPFSATFGSNQLLTASNASVFSWGQWNDHNGKTLSTLFYGAIHSGFNIAGPSFTITTGQTFGSIAIRSNSNSSLLSGTHTFGFKTGANQVGWIQMNMNGLQNPIYYLAAAFNNTPRGSIHVPVPVPVPSALALGALGLLAAGATEIRRRRKARAQSEAASA